MFPYIIQPDPPYEPGRPLSRLEVQQQFLDHKRVRHQHLSRGLDRPSPISLDSLLPGVRRSLGSMLIRLGSWMASGTAGTSVGPGSLVRR